MAGPAGSARSAAHKLPPDGSARYDSDKLAPSASLGLVSPVLPWTRAVEPDSLEYTSHPSSNKDIPDDALPLLAPSDV